MASTDPNKTVKTDKKIAKDASTQRYLPFSEIRDNMIVMKDGSSRMVLRIQALNFNLKSEEEQDAIIYGYQRFLNSLKFPVQIVIRSLKVDIESYLMKLKNLALRQTNPLLQEQTYQYVSFLTNLVDLAQIMRKDFYVIVPCDETGDQSVRDATFFGLFRNFWTALSSEETVQNIRDKRRNLEAVRRSNIERVTTVKGALESIGLKAQLVEKDDLVKLLIAYYNPKIGGDTKIRSDISGINIEQ